MPKIRATDFNIQTSNVSSVTVVMPPHETGDLLLVFAGKDDATGSDPATATSGWTRGGSGVSAGATTAAVRAAWFYKVAASSAEPDLVITSSDSDSWSIIAISIAGAHATPIDASSGNGNTDSTGAPFSVTGVTTNYDKSLVFFACLSGGTGCPVHYPGLQRVDNVDSGNEGLGVAYMVKRTAGATGNKDFYTDALNTNTIGFCVAVRDDGTGKEAPYWDTDYATLIHPFRGSSTIITSDAWGTALTNYPAGGKDAVAACFQEDSSGGPSYVDYTTAANDATDADVVPYPATEVAGASGTGDTFLIGYAKPFMSLLFDRLGCTQGVAGVVAWEYWNGSSWSALASVTDGTTSFTATLGDAQQVRWAMPARFNWRPTSINGSASLYFVRARCTTVWTTNPTISQVYVGGLPLVYDAVAASTDAGVIQFENAANVTPAASTAQAGGTYIDLGSTVDLANKVIVGTYQFSLPRDYVDSARFKEGGGVHVMFADTSFNRKTWCVGSYKDAYTNDAQRNRFAIDWEQSTDTTHSRTTTDPSDTVADVGIFQLAPRGAGAVAFSHMMAVTPTNCVLNGGSSTVPITLDEFLAMGDASPVQLFRDGVIMIPVTFGGSDSMHYALDGFTLSFPGVATPWTDLYNTLPRSSAHYDEGTLGFTLDARSGDTLKMTNGKISSDSPWKFDVAVSASNGATWDFSNLLLINANVTLRAVHTWSGITFQDCASFTQNGATIDSSFFIDTKITSDDPEEITNCSFENTGVERPAIETTMTGTFTFTGNTFDDYGPTRRTFHTTNDVNGTTDVVTTDAAHGYSVGDPIYYYKMGGSAAIGLTDGSTYYVSSSSPTQLAFFTSSTDATSNSSKINLTANGSDTHHLYSPYAAIFNNTSGSLTLNITGGGDTPSYRVINYVSSSVTINNNVTITLTGLQNPTEVRVFEEGTTTEITGEENITDGTFEFSVAASEAVDISILALGYQNQRILNYSSATDATLPITQQIDRQYNNP